ncbi:MAG: RluA family pseudouridine synthase [Acidobacteriota bacterium]
MALTILYEDEALLFVDKPPGLVVQRGYDADEPVLIDVVQDYLRPKNEHAYLMQRLDRGTSGAIFFSKLSRINAGLTRQFERKSIRKAYLAICEGAVHVHQTIDAPLARIGPISFGVRDEGKRAVTVITPLGSSDSSSFLAIDLLSGRTHQIRVHLAAIGHPLVGDWLYGERNTGRPMLHAASLTMRHPLSGQELSVHAALPADFLKEMACRSIPTADIAILQSEREDTMTSGEGGNGV